MLMPRAGLVFVPPVDLPTYSMTPKILLQLPLLILTARSLSSIGDMPRTPRTTPE